MKIIWDEEKAAKLLATRDISFEEIAQIIIEQKYLEILENSSHPEQMIFLVKYKEYIHVVPFIIDDENTIILKTVFPSRKFQKLYGEKNEKNKA